jgi:hypothetical protein
MEINLQNIEELIFFDKKVHSFFPEFRHLFDQWQLGLRVPGMRTLGQRSVLELLNSLNEKNISKLEEYFSDKILVNKIDHRIVAHYNFNIGEDNRLCEFAGFRDFTISKKKDAICVSFWR